MSSQLERTPQEQESDAELAALLREVARPEPAALDVAAHVRIPPAVDLDQRVLAAMIQERGDEHAPRPGELLEQHYRVERELGRGGMGIVYEALNLRTGKRVALKWMVCAGGFEPERRKAQARRFRREARAAASVRHANVVDIYDVAGPDAAPFLVMELLEGEPLRALMARERASWERAVDILLPVLRGVGAMHQAGVIHRDLKPDNIFLCRHGDGPLPKVLDFGVAAMQDSSDELGSLTRSGTLLGTPSYMALEQLTGKSVDARADLYALGVVLYELLTGKLPFAAASAGELAVMQATGRPTPPSRHDAVLAGAREALLLKALARDPSDRFASAEAFAEALRGAAANRPPWRQKRARGALLWLGLSLLAGAYAWWRVRAVGESPVPRGVEPSQLVSPATAPPAHATDAELPGPAQREVELPRAPAATEKVPQAPQRKRIKRVDAPRPVPPEKRPTDLNIDDF